MNEYDRNLLKLICEVIEDNKFTKNENERVFAFLQEHQTHLSEWPFRILIDRYRDYFSDEKIDGNERGKLLTVMKAIHRSQTETVPLEKLYSHEPVYTNGCTFCFTGVFLFGLREACIEATEMLNGEYIYNDRPCELLDYLVVGTLPKSGWKHGDWGKKIDEAVAYNESKTANIHIVSERQWYEAILHPHETTPQRPSELRQEENLFNYEDTLITIWEGKREITFTYKKRFEDFAQPKKLNLFLEKILRKPNIKTTSYYLYCSVPFGHRTYHWEGIQGNIIDNISGRSFTISEFFSMMGITNDLSFLVKDKLNAEF